MDTEEYIFLSAPSSKEPLQPEPQRQSLYGQQMQAEEKKYRAKGSKGIASRAIHGEIAGFATHIRQLKERLLDLPKNPDPAIQPHTHENHREEEPFPGWLV